MIDPQLQNKVVLITRANHGIGAATGQAFAAQGARVFITYYRGASRYSEQELQRAREAGVGGDALYHAMQQQSADWLVQQIRAQGGVGVAREADFADTDHIPLLFDWCETELGPVD